VHDPGSLAFITEDSAFIRTVKPGRYPIAVAVARPENEPEYCGRVAAAGGGVHDHEYKFKLSEAIDDMTVVRMKFISGFRPMRTDMVVA
jgi:hypothetical protein